MKNLIETLMRKIKTDTGFKVKVLQTDKSSGIWFRLCKQGNIKGLTETEVWDYVIIKR